MGMKGSPAANRFIDCDVIVAEVRETSRKPDEIYGMIERLSPGTRKLGTVVDCIRAGERGGREEEKESPSQPCRALWAATQRAPWVGHHGQPA